MTIEKVIVFPYGDKSDDANRRVCFFYVKKEVKEKCKKKRLY